MELIQQKKKPAAKLEQIILPDKEKKQCAESQVKYNITTPNSHFNYSQKTSAKNQQKSKEFSVSGIDTVCTGIESAAPNVNSTTTGVTSNSGIPFVPAQLQLCQHANVLFRSQSVPFCLAQPEKKGGLELSVSGMTGNSMPVQPAEQIVTTSNPILKQLKKRGRKRKIPIDEKYANPEYVVMWPEICMAQKVLVDRYDNVYTYDLSNPVWLGVKTVYGKIDNVTYSAPLTKYYFQ